MCAYEWGLSNNLPVNSLGLFSQCKKENNMHVLQFYMCIQKSIKYKFSNFELSDRDVNWAHINIPLKVQLISV